MMAVLLTILAASPAAQSSSPLEVRLTPDPTFEVRLKPDPTFDPTFEDLAPDIASRIAAALPAGSSFTITTTPVDVAALLTSGGFRLVPAGDGIPTVEIRCEHNLRERVCLVDIQGATRTVAIVARPHVETRAEDGGLLSLELRPLFSQKTAILDVVLAGDRLIVLDARGVTLYAPANPGWRPVQSQAITTAQPWPRDLRGHLRAVGERIEVFLPGVTCVGSLALNDLACTEGRQPWPIGIENSGLDVMQNVFTTRDGLAFYAAAVLGSDAGARWLVGTREGTLVMLDDAGRPVGTAAAGDDLAGLIDRCRSASHVVVRSAATNGAGDALGLFQVNGRRLVAEASPVVLPGVLTALWAPPGATVGTVIAHDAENGRYDAFQISIACVR